ncbi:16S rRNA (guanine(966)-N(2))-methyltransferase RsmD [Atopobiaceae bacterium 24-176]
MRIVGGRWRGRQLGAPEGLGTRPSTDRMREAVASMVASARGLDLSGAWALDAFAGSGALGLEIVSRGAEGCVLVDRDRRAAACARKNVESLGARAEARVVQGDVVTCARCGRLGERPFDIVLLDPPYRLDPQLSAALVEALMGHGLLCPGAIVVHERSSAAAPLAEQGLHQVRSRSHGESVVTLFEYEGAEGGEDGR